MPKVREGQAAGKAGHARQATAYLKSGERMPEVADASVKLVMQGSAYLGKKAGWEDYAHLYRAIFLEEGARIVRPDGWLVSCSTDEYTGGRLRFKAALLHGLLGEAFEILDVKVWKRRAMDFFQVPFSVITVWRPKGGTASRAKIKHRPYLDGIWDFKQANKGGDAWFPDGLCDVLIDAFTSPGDLVVDPLCGSGRLLGRAAAQGRTAIGYEINKELAATLAANGVAPHE